MSTVHAVRAPTRDPSLAVQLATQQILELVMQEQRCWDAADAQRLRATRRDLERCYGIQIPDDAS